MNQTKSSNCPHHKMSEEQHNSHKKNISLRFLFPLIGLASLIWMLIRIIPKPTRAQYPCMKVAAPIASSFIAYVAGMAIMIFSFKRAGNYFRKSKYIFAIALVFIGLIAGMFTILKTNTESYAFSISSDSVFVPTDSANHPVGTARGIFPGRVVWMRDSMAAQWNGTSGKWWSETNTNQTVVDSMLSRSLRALTEKSTDNESWDALFKYFNEQHGKGNIGFAAGEKIAIKININNSQNPGTPKNESVATPQTVLSLLRQLVYKAGVPDSNITFYDLIRYIPDPIYTKCKNEFPGVHFMGWSQLNGREKYVRDTTRIHWSENLTLEKDASASATGGNPTYLPTAVTKAAYLINLANLKGHSIAGITACAKNHFGTLSVDDDKGQPFVYSPHAAGVHPYVAVHEVGTDTTSTWYFNARPMGSYNALVDLMGHKDLGGKTLLFLVDALYAMQDEHGSTPVSLNSRWLSAPFNNDWTSSLFLSQDNVAIESVALDFLRNEQSINSNYTLTYGAVDNYLHEAALANDPPSGTYYSPSGNGVRLQSLGVHEHWNNPTDKQYSRNLDETGGQGIQLYSVPNIVTSVYELSKPSEFVLHQNYPNPFNPSTVIGYQLSVRSSVSLRIYDALGREVAVLVNEEKPAGKYEVQFNAKNLSSGIYFYKIYVKGKTLSNKMMYLK